MNIDYREPRSLQPRHRELRKRHPKQLAFLKRSVEENGFIEPVLVKDGRVVHGELRVAAAIEAGLNAIPTIELEHLTSEQVRAYAIAANQIGALAGFDEEALMIELGELADLNVALDSLGFEPAELDRLLGHFDIAGIEDDLLAAAAQGPAVTKPGDMFRFAKHRLLCGTSLEDGPYRNVLRGDLAELVLTDPPYNDKVSSISGNGRTQHREFLQASGEMSDPEFTRFLTTMMRLARRNSADGSLHYFFMCGRQLLQLLRAGHIVYDEQKALITWDKGVGGMGSLYRGQTEFVGVFKSGKRPHVNNIMLGKHGRNRTTLWQVDGLGVFSADRQELLAAHPSVKPVQLIADAILDASTPGGLVLDPFAGSGTIFLAAEQTGRRAAGLELDPLYCDVALRRYRKATGAEPVHAASGRTFADLEAEAAAGASMLGEAA